MFRLLDRISSEENESSLRTVRPSSDRLRPPPRPLQAPNADSFPLLPGMVKVISTPSLMAFVTGPIAASSAAILGGVWSGNFAVMIDTPAIMVRHHVVNCASHLASRSQPDNARSTGLKWMLPLGSRGKLIGNKNRRCYAALVPARRRRQRKARPEPGVSTAIEPALNPCRSALRAAGRILYLAGTFFGVAFWRDENAGQEARFLRHFARPCRALAATLVS
jgi:hypothetical protein